MEEIARQFAQLGADWVDHLYCLLMHVTRQFVGRGMQERVLEYVMGLLSPLERKNGRQLAEGADHQAPYEPVLYLSV